LNNFSSFSSSKKISIILLAEMYDIIEEDEEKEKSNYLFLNQKMIESFIELGTKENLRIDFNALFYSVNLSYDASSSSSSPSSPSSSSSRPPSFSIPQNVGYVILNATKINKYYDYFGVKNPHLPLVCLFLEGFLFLF
jgi:hypothetical protein